ncbi:response regulator [Thermogemmatispora carboxidivorans]|uniref:response regulator n=1 Tax=Thermogemmatispora carboxidivorans TaxID=1382306 RepID=UPI00069A025A|nr:response regulator [Thermogemmatispora carboxidivorans]
MSGTVDIIDDSAISRLIIALALRRAGFQVRCHSDSLAALQAIARAEEPPALLLIDLMLPKLNGYELTLLLRKQPRLSTIPIVLMSARHGLRERLRARLVGASAFLAKPFNIGHLVALVRRLTAASAPPGGSVAPPIPSPPPLVPPLLHAPFIVGSQTLPTPVPAPNGSRRPDS